MTEPTRSLDTADIGADYVARPVRPTASVELDDDEVLYLADPPMLFTLNATARVVWHSLDGEVSVGQLADELAEEFGVPRDRMREDVTAVIRDFGRGGLLDGVTAAEDVIEGHRLASPDAHGEEDDVVSETD